MKVCKYPGGCEIENQKRFDAGWCSVHRRRLVRDGDPGPPGLLRDPTRVCKVDGCDGKFFAKGFCEMHYARKRKGWDMDAPRQVRYRKGQVCSQDGCDRVVSAKGFCGMHWKRNHDNRDMDAPPKTRNKGQDCKQDGCRRESRSAGFCPMHYERARNNWDMDAPRKGSVEYAAAMAARVCEWDGCDDAVRSKGLCGLHYIRDFKNRHPQPGRHRTVRNMDAPRVGTPQVCKWGECDDAVLAKGLCRLHYQRDYMGQDMDAPRVVRDGSQGCKVDGCDREHSVDGWCRLHYRRARNGWDMDAPPKTRNKQLQVLDTTVYRFTDGAGRLLYVGITFDLDQRIAQHRHSQPWWDDVCIVTSHTEPTRVDALAVEAAAIRNEKPAHNVIHNGVA